MFVIPDWTVWTSADPLQKLHKAGWWSLHHFNPWRCTSTPIIIWIKLLCLATSLLALNFTSHTSTITTRVTSPSIRRPNTSRRRSARHNFWRVDCSIPEACELAVEHSNTFCNIAMSPKFHLTNTNCRSTHNFSHSSMRHGEAMAPRCFQWTYSFELCNLLWPGTSSQPYPCVCVTVQ